MRAWIVDVLGERAFEQLAATVPGSELQSLLLEVMRRRAAARNVYVTTGMGAQLVAFAFRRPDQVSPR